MVHCTILHSCGQATEWQARNQISYELDFLKTQSLPENRMQSPSMAMLHPSPSHPAVSLYQIQYSMSPSSWSRP